MSTLTDVNADFMNTKLAQIADVRTSTEQRTAWLNGKIASGGLRPLGNDRYMVAEGGDAGEVITVRIVQGMAEAIMGSHGLDLREDGKVALYTSTPAWHGLGQVIPGGISDVKSVMKLGGIDFIVRTSPVEFRRNSTRDEHGGFHFPPDEQNVIFPDRFVTYRADTGAELGVVGSRYTVVQNYQMFGFLQDLVGLGENGNVQIVWESAGALEGGSRVFVAMRLPEDIVIDPQGIADVVRPYLVFLNSHDGSSPARALLTPWRPVCQNTERFALRDAKSSWTVRHTAGALNKISQAREALGLTVKYYKAWAADEEALARTAVTIDQVNKLIDGLWKVDDEATKRSVKYAETRREDVLSIFQEESARVGRTAFAFERAVTGYVDKVAYRRIPQSMTEELHRATVNLEGADDKLKSKTHQKLMLLTRR